MPVQAPTRGHLFTVFQRYRPISVAFYNDHGDTEKFDSFKPPVPLKCKKKWRGTKQTDRNKSIENETNERKVFLLV